MSVQPDPAPSSRNSKPDPQIYARHSTADRGMFLESVTLFN